MKNRIVLGIGLLAISSWALAAMGAEGTITVKGEVVDTFCYATMGAGCEPPCVRRGMCQSRNPCRLAARG